jgi:group I intron endonuclease
MQTKNWYGFTVHCDNIPTKRAGIYMLTHIETGRVYIGISGNLEKRIREHGRPQGSKSKVGKAIYEHGADNFLAMPLLYTLDNSADGLTRIETELISAHDSIVNGFNVIANSSKAGKRGEAFCRSVRASHNTPEYVAKMKQILADPENTRKRSEAIRIAHARPETKEKFRKRRRPEFTPEIREKFLEGNRRFNSTPEAWQWKSEMMKKNHSDPDFKARHLAGVRQANADPVRNAKIAASRKGGMWITNGVNDRYIKTDADIPEGWSRGKVSSRKKAA